MALENHCLFFIARLLIFSVVFLIVSPTTTDKISPRFIGSQDRNLPLFVKLNDSSEPKDIYLDKLQTQYLDGMGTIMKKFLATVQSNSRKLNEVYKFIEELKQDQLRVQADEITSNMIRFPRARLYTGDNFTGNYEYYDLDKASEKAGCHQLQQYPGQIKSVDSEGTCVRVFSNCICQSWSQAIYPGSNKAVDARIQGVQCIGPCSSTEFDYAELQGSASNKAVLKNSSISVPDLIGDWSTRSGYKSIPNSRHAITKYYLGDGNRLMGVFGDIHAKHLRSPEVAEKVARSGRTFTDGLFQLNEETEQVGFAIPLELGGTARKVFNVFPQEKAQSYKYRGEFVPVVKQYLKDYPDDHVELALLFFYENSMARKPLGVWYHMVKVGAKEVTYGYLYNVSPSMN